MASALYVSNLYSIRTQLLEYANALEMAKPETSVRLKNMAEIADILSSLFKNAFDTGTLFMNGYLMQEKINFDLKIKLIEQEKRIKILETQLNRK